LLELGHKPTVAVTARQFPPRSDNDAVVAAELARECGLPHEVLDLLPRVTAELLKYTLTHFSSDEHAWFSAVASRVADRFDVTYDGLAGDTLCGATAWGVADATGVSKFAEGKTGEVARRMIRGVGVDAYRALCPGGGTPTVDDVVAFVVSELDKHRDAPSPAGAFLFWNRTRRKIGLMSAAMLPGVRYAFCPFMDRAIVELMSGVRPEHKLEDKFRYAVMRRAFPKRPEMRNVHADTGPSRLHYAGFAAGTAAYLLRKQLPWLRGAMRFGRTATAYTFGGRRPRRWLSPSRILYAIQLDHLRSTSRRRG
jgi:hypothetical protein